RRARARAGRRANRRGPDPARADQVLDVMIAAIIGATLAVNALVVAYLLGGLRGLIWFFAGATANMAITIAAGLAHKRGIRKETTRLETLRQMTEKMRGGPARP